MKQDNDSPAALLICLGNEYRQDDGVGPFIARHPRIRHLQSLRVIENRGDGMDLVEAWKGQGLVILVDAVRSGKPAGTLLRLDALDGTLPPDIFLTSTHQLGIPECIALSRCLGFLPQRMLFYGIEALHTGRGAGLSDPVLAAAAEAVKMIAADLRLLE